MKLYLNMFLTTQPLLYNSFREVRNKNVVSAIKGFICDVSILRGMQRVKHICVLHSAAIIVSPNGQAHRCTVNSCSNNIQIKTCCAKVSYKLKG
jgi:hypothetical protein